MGFRGRPPMFRNPEDMEAQIAEYFLIGVNTREVVIGKPPNQQVVEVQVPTISGLCHYLGFESRQSFYDYEAFPDFAYLVKNARLSIERHYEEGLQVGNTVGSIFALKNMGWRDKTETDVTSKGESIAPPVINIMRPQTPAEQPPETE